MGFRLSEEQEMIRRTVREFAEKEIRPHVMEWDEAQHFPRDVMMKLGEMGLLGVTVPEEYGGAGFEDVTYAMVIEELARVDGGLALSVAAHNSLGTGHIALVGTEEQKRNYLVPLAGGKKIAAWGLTEPEAGSDAGGTKTRAVKQGSEWVLNGEKTFTTHGSAGDILVLMASTEPEKGTKGISAFIVPRGTKGLIAGRKENKLGCRCSDTSSVILEDCRIPEENLLGKLNDGFRDAMRILDGGRISIAALGVGMAQGAYETALAYAKERKQFGKPIASFQAISGKLADMVTSVTAARLLTYDAASKYDRHEKTTLASAMAKYYAGETAVRVANEAVQILGGYGYVKDYPAEKFYRDAKLCTIGEGTSEIQKLVMARQITR